MANLERRVEALEASAGTEHDEYVCLVVFVTPGEEPDPVRITPWIPSGSTVVWLREPQESAEAFQERAMTAARRYSPIVLAAHSPSAKVAAPRVAAP
jgi:hypothetical protein